MATSVILLASSISCCHFKWIVGAITVWFGDLFATQSLGPHCWKWLGMILCTQFRCNYPPQCISEEISHLHWEMLLPFLLPRVYLKTKWILWYFCKVRQLYNSLADSLVNYLLPFSLFKMQLGAGSGSVGNNSINRSKRRKKRTKTPVASTTSPESNSFI